MNEKYGNLALSQVHHLQTTINRQRNMNKSLVITDTEFKHKMELGKTIYEQVK